MLLELLAGKNAEEGLEPGFPGQRARVVTTDLRLAPKGEHWERDYIHITNSNFILQFCLVFQ